MVFLCCGNFHSISVLLFLFRRHFDRWILLCDLTMMMTMFSSGDGRVKFGKRQRLPPNVFHPPPKLGLWVPTKKLR